jgi:uncharacterized protein (TIGR04551 family)
MFQRPHGRRELENRRRDLDELRRPVFDWGFYNIIRTQDVMSGYTGIAKPLDVEDTGEDDSSVGLFPVNAFFYSPDLWLDLQYRPTPSTAYRLQIEAAGVFGSIETLPGLRNEDTSECVENTAETDPDTCLKQARRQDVQKFGYALEFDARHRKLRYGFHHGLATGDKHTGFGYLDASQLPRDGREAGQDKTLSAFRFDRDYHVDLILFRELIGGVTNAAYFKPYFGYDFVQRPREIWGAKLSSIYAFALEAQSTPGRESPLGLEFDVEVFFKKAKKFHWSLAYGLLFPMSAFKLLGNDGEPDIEPSIAQTIQMVMGMEF